MVRALSYDALELLSADLATALDILAMEHGFHR